FFFSSRRRHTRFSRDWSSDVCSSDLWLEPGGRQWASAPAVSGLLDANAFRGGAVILRDVVLERANVLLTQTSDDVPWNYERVFEIGRASCRESVWVLLGARPVRLQPY